MTVNTVRLFSFASWDDVIAHVERDEPIYYHAPLDVFPKRIAAQRRKGRRVRVLSLGAAFDSFTADDSHLERFRKGSP